MVPAMAAALTLAVGLASIGYGQQATISRLNVSPNPVALGEQVTIIAAVQTEGAWPVGTVAIRDDMLLLQETDLDEGGSCGILVDPDGVGARFCTRRARFTTSTLSAGLHPLTSSFSGDADTLPSTSEPVLLRVQPTPRLVPLMGPVAALTLTLLLCTAGYAVLRHNKRPTELS